MFSTRLIHIAGRIYARRCTDDYTVTYNGAQGYRLYEFLAARRTATQGEG